MTRESRHISEWIDRPADEVYEYAAAPANLPQWARGLGSSVEKIGDRWFVETRAGVLASPSFRTTITASSITA
jgi:uncharacterized membrane protein